MAAAGLELIDRARTEGLDFLAAYIETKVLKNMLPSEEVSCVSDAVSRRAREPEANLLLQFENPGQPSRMRCPLGSRALLEERPQLLGVPSPGPCRGPFCFGGGFRLRIHGRDRAALFVLPLSAALERRFLQSTFPQFRVNQLAASSLLLPFFLWASIYGNKVGMAAAPPG